MPRAKKPTGAAAVAAAAAAAAVKAATKENENVVRFVLPDDDDEDDDLVAQGDILEDLEKIDADHGGGITWELYCDVPLDKSGQITKLARSELRTLRDRCIEFGPGEYHVVARASNGLFVKNTRRNIKISGLARGAVPPPAAPAPDPMSMILLIEERAEKRRLQASKDRMEQIKFWAPILAPIGLEAAKGLFGNRGESIKDMVAAMVGLKELNGSGDKTVDALLKGIELAQSLAPEAPSKGSTWSDVLVNGLRELRPLLEQRQQARAPTATPSPQLQFVPTPQATAAGAAGNGSAAAAPAGSSPPADAETDEMIKTFEPLLRKLATELEEYATNAAEPELTAEALLAKVPRLVKSQITHAQLKGWLTDARWWDVLSTFHPPLGPYQAYCDQVREELLVIVEAEDQGDDIRDGEAAP